MFLTVFLAIAIANAVFSFVSTPPPYCSGFLRCWHWRPSVRCGDSRAQVRAFSFAKGGLLAAAAMHRQLLASVLAAPCSFFDTTPSGAVMAPAGTARPDQIHHALHETPT